LAAACVAEVAVLDVATGAGSAVPLVTVDDVGNAELIALAALPVAAELVETVACVLPPQAASNPAAPPVTMAKQALREKRGPFMLFSSRANCRQLRKTPHAASQDCVVDTPTNRRNYSLDR